MMPMWIFSGVFFSYGRFPQIVQPAPLSLRGASALPCELPDRRLFLKTRKLHHQADEPAQG